MSEPTGNPATFASNVASFDWSRLLPDTDHRWAMGLRPGNAAEFFAPRDSTGRLLAERAHWLRNAPADYSAMTPIAVPALRETNDWARSLRFPVEPVVDDDAALLALAHAWEPDFVWLQPDEVGTFRLIGGVVCFPSSWSLRDKLNLPITAVHAPVPALNRSLGRQIDTFLAALVPGAAWTRENLGFSRDAELNHHPSRSLPRLDESVTIDEVWLRVEQQLLLKLPASGSVLFGIRIAVVSLRDVLRIDNLPRRLIRWLKTMSDEAAAYKGLASARDAIIQLAQSCSLD
jgi:hypothetical protein